ncbi:biotin--[acetyl-CoA-carboxylase] ligase [Feifania hominis]|uniref:Bifunctional ligase/repressor BirA n=1 Tax=Feifania hominis TaxID=2763660 RepID=A0A926DDM0_9FIRM|nr:biotin--[acetyl-CoA-carboxylase] ligase [Feifania hominis]MBC8535912.1 biotin--[acetyl-CoA-carboxylase] ligase [Feifania hominis]
MLKDEVYHLLRQRRGETISGSDLARALGVSRTAVWKAAHQLIDEGAPVEPLQSGGYRIPPQLDLLDEMELREELCGSRLGEKILLFDRLDSTNNYAKSVAADAADGTLVVARQQTAGRGRMERRFHSPEGGGVYFTIVLRPHFALDALNFVTLLSAMAVRDAVEKLCGFRPSIKWPNDVLVDGEKLCGILTESALEAESGRIQYVLAGIGINIRLGDELPEELRGVATALDRHCAAPPSRAALIAGVVREFDRLYDEGRFIHRRGSLLEDYRRDLCWVNERITILRGGEAYAAVLRGLDDEGHLVVELPGGGLETLYAGEIKIRRETQI